MKKIFISFVFAVFLITNFIGAAFSENAVGDVDFGPYMREVQRHIKRNWNPPRKNEPYTVIVRYKINKDGTCPSVRIVQSSGIRECDEAAIAAVKKTAPFKPLPSGFKGNDVEVEFTFDYKVHIGFNSTKIPYTPNRTTAPYAPYTMKKAYVPSQEDSNPIPLSKAQKEPALKPTPIPDVEDVPELEPIPLPEVKNTPELEPKQKIAFLSVIGLSLTFLILIIITSLTISNRKNDKNKGL